MGPTRSLLLLGAVLSAQSPDVPDWQTAAGGKLSFEVASVKPSKTFRGPTFPLDSGNAVRQGGRFSAGMKLLTYIFFAYKVDSTAEQTRAVFAQIPKSLTADFFEIEARAPGNATKDQLRLMMQSLLAERFKLAVHFESPEIPVMALTLDKPGKLGPSLRPHSESPPCAGYPAIDPHAFPSQCDAMILTLPRDGTARAGSRNTSPSLLARDIASMGSLAGEVDKPVVDRTGLKDTFDYVLEWSGRLPGQPPPPAGAAPPPPETPGTGFLQAVREQLGLKLVPGRAAVRTIFIDHVESPSEN